MHARQWYAITRPEALGFVCVGFGCECIRERSTAYAQIMMDVDQPVSSTTGDEQAELDAESSHGKVTDKASNTIVQENDELPALLISDSEEDEPPKAPSKENKPVDISGISPIETSVANVNDKCDDSRNETTVHPTQEISALSAVDEDEISLVENIDLTGTSSAEDSTVNEPSSERKAPSVVKTPTLTKPSSEMTAQELLESLLEAQEEAFASQKAEETSQSKDADKTINTSEVRQITKNNVDSAVGEIAKDTPNAVETGEGSLKKDALVVDDECLLEEMVNEPEKQQEMDIDEHPTGTNNSSCSEDGSGASHNSDDGENVKTSKRYDNDDIVTLSVESGEMEECSEPPRKRARSVAFNADSESKSGTSEFTFHDIENNTVQNEKPSENVASNTENMYHGTKHLDLHSEGTTNLSEIERKPTSDALADKSQTVLMIGSSDTSNDNGDLLNGGPQQKQSIAVGDSQQQQCIAAGDSKQQQGIAVGDEKSVQPEKVSVCPDVLVIDDDDDETDVTSDKVQDLDDKKTDALEENSKQMISPSATTVKSPNVDDASSQQLSPTPKEKLEPKPMAMEFLQRFNKSISTMTRLDLEQLVLQKIGEIVVHQSENAELRRIVKRQSAKLQGYERTITDMSSHYEGLKLVAERAVEDMKKRAKSFVAPVKITRAVGLQVSRPAMEMGSSYKSANLSRIMLEKRKASASAIVTMNGVFENRAQTKPGEPINKATQPTATFTSGQQNASANMNRSNNTSPMTTARITPNIPMANGLMRTLSSQVGKHNNSTSTTNASITTGGSTVKLATTLSKDGPGASIANTATFASTSPNTGSAANSITGGIESPVRKKFHKFTPKRPPLSPYQQAQQEKQARQQQELLVQQIHEQSQQAQRKAQINVRSDLPQTEISPARMSMDANARQRSITAQGRLLNTNHQIPVSQNYQIVPLGATRTTSSMTNSTTPQLSEPKSNSQPATTVASSANDSLIDLTEEDDTSGRESGIVPSMQAKRMKSSHSGPFTSTPPMSGNQGTQNASNQNARFQPKITTINGNETVPAGASTTSAGSVNQFNRAAVRAPLNVNRTTNALQPLRQPLYNGNLPRLAPISSADALIKRAILSALPQPGPQPSDPTWKLSPPQPLICVNNVQTGIVISWTMPPMADLYATIETYQIYAYQELTNSTAQEEWRHVGDVKALLLPMAVTLTQFQKNQRYYFAVRAIDEHKRVGKFCEPRTWNESNERTNN
uniref:Fibronectin type-III domain-containing protein n=1 Tax=Anopheles culicifacies TaxID=139723 RepID=A0A182M8W0_9DIPT